MEENEEKKLNFRVVMLVVSVVSFLAVIGSASFAFFSTNTADPNSVASIANANVTLPMGCTFIATPSASCDITGQTGSTVNFVDNIITTAEMTETYNGNRVAVKTCEIEVAVNGNKGCTCDYSVKIEKNPSSATYSPTSTGVNEFTASVYKGLNTEVIQQANINTLVNSKYDSSLTVSATGNSESQRYIMTIAFYNINANQGTTIAGKNYSYQLKAYATKCNGATLS